MSNEYGQQPYPGHQPPIPGYGAPAGSGYPQQGYPQGQPGYPGTPPGGQPVYAGQPYPQGQGGYGGGYGPAPVEKPGGVTGAAVLGFIQAGITLITTGLLFAGLFAAGGGPGIAIGWAVALAQLAGLILLIFGAVQLMSGTNRMLYVIGAILELVICAYYLINIAISDTDTGNAAFSSALGNLKAAATVVPIVFAVMPLIGLILALGSSTTSYLQAKAAQR
ncbi:hypothetical protein JOF56_004638 [Kibdelosporangium banguiense]|uniref:Uncharacterized protein n=1 Tax=Kibdelosporangium banguiense TaxID=1365924 RepID=A0ABS4TIK0_9PSEU|nr:hypothetical protein [Kibdelosporangium banguiense]MBP2324253.1 hypothetical protein [Kibdelosporangium banguiense]